MNDDLEDEVLGDEHSVLGDDLMYPYERKCFDLVVDQDEPGKALEHQSRLYDTHKGIHGSFKPLGFGDDYFSRMNARFKFIYDGLKRIYCKR
jgi:hypothetical protein